MSPMGLPFDHITTFLIWYLYHRLKAPCCTEPADSLRARAVLRGKVCHAVFSLVLVLRMYVARLFSYLRTQQHATWSSEPSIVRDIHVVRQAARER